MGRRSISSLWIAQWTSSASCAATALAKRRKSSTISSGSAGNAGCHGSSPNISTKRGSRRRSFDCQPDQGAGRFLTTEKRNQPSSVRIRSVPGPRSRRGGSPSPTGSCRGSSATSRRPRNIECSKTSDGSPATSARSQPMVVRVGLRNRQVEDPALLGEDDRLLDVVREGLIRLGNERRGLRHLLSFGHAHLPVFRRRSLRNATGRLSGKAPARAVRERVQITFRSRRRPSLRNGKHDRRRRGAFRAQVGAVAPARRGLGPAARAPLQRHPPTARLPRAPAGGARGLHEPTRLRRVQWVVDFHTRLLARVGVQVSDARPAAWGHTADVSLDDGVHDELAQWLKAIPCLGSRADQGSPSFLVPAALEAMRRGRRRDAMLCLRASPSGCGRRVEATLVRWVAGRREPDGRLAEPDALHRARDPRGPRVFVRYEDLLDD